MSWAVIETVDGSPTGVHVRPTNEEAIDLALTLGEKNGLFDYEYKFRLRNEGHYSDGNYRVSVVHVAEVLPRDQAAG